MEDAYVFSNIEGIFWREKLKDSDLLVEKWCSYHHLPKSICWGIFYVFEISLEARKNNTFAVFFSWLELFALSNLFL